MLFHTLHTNTTRTIQLLHKINTSRLIYRRNNGIWKSCFIKIARIYRNFLYKNLFMLKYGNIEYPSLTIIIDYKRMIDKNNSYRSFSLLIQFHPVIRSAR